MVLSSDHVSPATGKTVSVTLSKSGAAFGAASGAVTEISSGVYSLAGNATDSNTLGSLVVLATATGCDPYLVEYTVVPYNPFDAVRMGLTALPNAAAEAAGGLYTRGSGAGQINQDANGRIDVNAKAWIGGTIPAVNVTGVPKVDLVDWNGSAPNNLVNGRVDSYPTVVQSGTAQAGASSSITLAAGASATDSLYVGELVYIHSGTGAGQTRIISAYVGSTKVATVAQAWTTTPDATSVYAVLGLGRALVDSNLDKTGYTASTVSDKTGYSLAADQAVNVTKFNGTAVTARDIGASVLISSGTGTGQLGVTSGVIKANLVQILGTALTETAGQIAGAFKQFFNVATPTGTVNSLPNANPGANGGLPTVDANNAVKLQSGTGANQISLSSGAVTVGTNNDKTGYALTAGEHTNIASDTQTGMTAQGYTTTRAGYLDTLNGLVQAIWDKATSSLTTVGSVGKLLVDNVNATISSRMATFSLPTNFSSLVIDANGRVDLSKVLGSTINALISGRIDANAQVVGDKTGYALTAGEHTSIASDVLNATAASYNTANTIGNKINSAASGSSPSTIAAAVWDEPVASHLTAGSTGNKLNSAANAGDPWTTTLPGSYTGSQAGAILPAIKTKTDTISAGAMYVSSPVLTNGRITLVKGDDYKNADGRALFATTTFSNAPSLTGGGVTFKIKNGTAVTTKSGTITGASACYVEMGTADTDALAVGDYAYDLEAALSNGDIVTLAQGTLTVITDVR
jgi:hypothetical protein